MVFTGDPEREDSVIKPDEHLKIVHHKLKSIENFTVLSVIDREDDPWIWPISSESNTELKNEAK